MRRLIRFALVSVFLAWPVAAPAAGGAGAGLRSPAAALLAELTPAERVGQLFIVSFRGASAEPGTDVYRLITESHIGGVVLLASQDNFTDESNLPAQVLTLTNHLQSAALALTLAIPTPLAPAESQTPPAAAFTPTPGAASPTPPVEPPFTPVPLFIAVSHEGGGSPFTQIRSGLTDLPSPMAIGATWARQQAEAIGAIAGKELAAVGANMLLGPSLDVLFNPRPEASGDVGARAFGGDPYWVGQMGAAYIRGVHAGSAGQMLVVAQHFPGLGSSDRPPEEEIATILKSLEQLKQIELAPFFAVTGRAPDSQAAADALLISHIRYQGFQGNIRQTTRPISLDPQAFAQLFALPEFSAWRQAGGLVVSDSLGARAIRRFYDPTEKTFQARKIALDAFLAGNDLLLLTDFGLNPAIDQTAQIQDVIASFVQKYQNDPTFAERVDAAATRILARKMQLYGDLFAPERVLRPTDGLEAVGQGQATVFNVAQNAVSLISPSLAELAARLPEPPARTDRIVIFTDTRELRQCSLPGACPPHPVLALDALKEDILRLYGPGAGGQVRAGDIQSYSFAELAAFLKIQNLPPPPEGGTPVAPSPVEIALAQADWTVFAMLNVDPALPDSRALKDFLAARPDAGRTYKVIAFAVDAPYYLDTTEISKLTAYYGLYGRAGAFHEVAARVLFQELTPSGASPVSVAGVAYDLIEQTAPDPAQIIEIFIVEPAGAAAPTPTPAGTAESTPESIGVGETLFLRTGVIRDRNGHPVPDGTIVRLIAQYPADGLSVTIPDAPTVDGLARASFVPPRRGQIDIRAESEPAFTSITLQITIKEATTIVVTIQPTLPATATPPPTSTAPSATPTPGQTSTPTPVPQPQTLPPLMSFFSLLVGLVVFGVAGLRVGRGWPGGRGRRLALLAALGALIGYNYYALGLPGVTALNSALPYWSGALVTWGGGLLGLGAGWFRYGRREPSTPTAGT